MSKSRAEQRPDLSTDPAIAIIVSRRFDPYYRWDGDGPDPSEDGFDAYDVTVKAISIKGGRLIEGASTLGGSYFADDEPLDDVHGYLPQMVEEALEELKVEEARQGVQP